MTAPLVGTLAFVPDPRRRGFPFRRGHFEVAPDDPRRIAEAMGVALGDALEPAAAPAPTSAAA